MDTGIELPTTLNRYIVLPPLAQRFESGDLTLAEALEKAYEEGLRFGFQAGLDEERD
jgi:hypothetical protein